MQEPKRFWMVHGDGTGPTNYRHEAYQLARDEAKRLARRCPDTVFYVLEAVSAHIKVDVQEMRIDPSSSPSALPAELGDDIPF